MKKFLFSFVALSCLLMLTSTVYAQQKVSFSLITNNEPFNTPEFNVDLKLILQNPTGRKILGVQWFRNGVNFSSTGMDIVQIDVAFPGLYSAIVSYTDPVNTKILTNPYPQPNDPPLTKAINASNIAPNVTLTSFAYNPLTASKITFLDDPNSCSSALFYELWRDGSLISRPNVICPTNSGSPASVSIDGPGRYFLGVQRPRTGKVVYSNEIVVTLGSTPTPVITGPDVMTYDAPTVLSTITGYNGGYTWFLNGQPISGAHNNTFTVTTPGDYSVQGCLRDPKTTATSCATSAVKHITGEIMTVNSIQKQVVLTDNKKEASMASLTPTDVATSTTYFDGMARAIQEVESNAAGNSTLNDVVVVHQYDLIGRETKQILPFTRSSSSFVYVKQSLDPIKNFYQQDNDKIANTAFPYGETQFEASPLNRPLKQGAPGEDWQLSGTHVKSIKYLNVNSSIDNVRIVVPTTNGVSATTLYPNGSLSIVEVTDEDGKVTREYKDNLNRTVMSEQTGDKTQRTYTVYDDFNHIVCIIPPNESLLFASTSLTITGDELARECYFYTYDERGRIATKTIPGGGTNYFVYDKWDRVVLSQHSNQRAQGRWTFNKYDVFDRVVMTGEINLAGDNVAATQTVNSFYAGVSSNPSLRYEEFTTDVSKVVFHGYTNRTFPVLTNQYQAYSVIYFGDYRFLSDSDPTYKFVPETDLGLTTFNTRTQGLVTGVKNIYLGTHNYLQTVTYYDDKHRVIQVISDNHLGGVDRVSNQLDFTGNVLKNRSIHHGKQDVTIDEEFTYDIRKRKLQEFSTINGGPKVMLYDFHYNALSQLVEKNIHSTDNGQQFLQSLDYSYNIRGWLQQMNPADDNAETNVKFQDQYGFDLSYTTSNGLDEFTPTFNGNIGAFTQRRPATTDETGTLFSSAYTYQYDARNQLTRGRYLESGKNGMFDLTNIAYDHNGNIISLKRNGVTTSGANGTIDDLSYSYSGNQLKSVTDTGDKAKGFIIK